MQRRKLIISDNKYLLQKSIDIIANKNYFKQFDFFSSNQLIINDIQINKIDLKCENDIALLIDNYDLIFSIHCKQIFPPLLVNNIKCYNLHPGYNPINRGWYPQVFAIINNYSIGATIHEIDEGLDSGKIIDRQKLEIFSDDTSLKLYNRILELELELFRKNVDSIIDCSYSTIDPENEGNLFLKNDFNRLCQLNMQQQGSFYDFYNLLRALTFDGYKNAYFIDPIDKKRVFVSINLEKET